MADQGLKLTPGNASEKQFRLPDVDSPDHLVQGGRCQAIQGGKSSIWGPNSGSWLNTKLISGGFLLFCHNSTSYRTQPALPRFLRAGLESLGSQLCFVARANHLSQPLTKRHILEFVHETTPSDSPLPFSKSIRIYWIEHRTPVNARPRPSESGVPAFSAGPNLRT